MNELVITILISPLLVAASQACHEFVMRWIAANRLKHDPLYDVGSVMSSITEGDTVVFGRCRVRAITTGRIELRGIDSNGLPTGLAKSFTVREFVKRFDPEVEVDDRA